MSNKFKEGLAVLLASTTILGTAAGAVGCEKENIKITQDKKNKGQSKDAVEFYEIEELNNAYNQITNSLKEKENLSREEIIEICNIYKKMLASIKNLDLNYNTEEIKDFYNTFPDVDSLYEGMLLELEELLSKENILRIPNSRNKDAICEKLLLDTGMTPFQKIMISRDGNSNKYFVSTKDDVLFSFTDPGDKEGVFLEIDMEGSLPQNKEKDIIKKSIPITEPDKEIPKYDVGKGR